jgi:hypothetical protein
MPLPQIYVPGKSTSASRAEVIRYLRERYRDQAAKFPELRKAVTEELYVKRNLAPTLRAMRERAKRETNPIRRVKGGYRWGGHGHVYPTRAGALRQARAAFAHGYREKNPMRVSNKDPGEMSASQINTELDRLSAEDSKVNSELIAAGRGHEKYWDILKKDDPLSRKALALVSRRHKLMIEVERRAGPGMHRLPRGFGPIRNPVYQTVRLNNGVVVLAKDYKGRPHAYTYANLTQAKKKAAEVGGYVTGHRPYYIAIETGTDRVSNPARRLYYRVRR